MKRAWQNLAHKQIIASEIHMIPFKINNYNHMKKTIVTCFLLFNCVIAWTQNANIPTFGTDGTLEIATWNIEHFPKNDQNTIDSVSQIIKALDIDIISFQEIDDTVSFKQMINNLPDYQYYFKSQWYGGLAYIYKTDVIQINDFYEIYTTSPYWSPFPRSPLVMDINFMGQNIIVINNHFKCCGNGILDLNNSGDEESRRYIASNLLKEYIDNYFTDKKVLVVGDLNDNIAESESNNVFINIINENQNYLFADMEIAQGDKSDWSYPTWPSHLDHILITNELFADFHNDNSEIKTIKIDQYLTNGWNEYDYNISDHRPVAIKLKLESTSNSDFLTNDELLKIYPNPATSILNFRLNNLTNNSRIEIYNSMGQLVKLINMQENQANLTLQLDSFDTGIYIVKLHTGNNTELTKRIVILKQ